MNLWEFLSLLMKNHSLQIIQKSMLESLDHKGLEKGSCLENQVQDKSQLTWLTIKDFMVYLKQLTFNCIILLLNNEGSVKMLQSKDPPWYKTNFKKLKQNMDLYKDLLNTTTQLETSVEIVFLCKKYIK